MTFLIRLARNNLAGNFYTGFVTMLVLLPLALSSVAHGQDYTYTTNNGTITITKYTGPDLQVTIPSEINGLPVTVIGQSAFGYTALTSVTVPNSVTVIGDVAFQVCTNLTGVTLSTSLTAIGNMAFSGCSSLTNVSIPNGVTSISVQTFGYCWSLSGVTIPSSVTVIGDAAFYDCISLTNVTIPNAVTSIGSGALANCTSLTKVSIPSSVRIIGDGLFSRCSNLIGVYFEGSAPAIGSFVLGDATNATTYYLPGTTGWAPTFAGRPTALWELPYPVILNSGPSFGVQTNGFGFTISWVTNVPVVVEASAIVANPTWAPVGTNTLTAGSSYFSDPQWTNSPSRFYRLRSP